MGLLKPINLFYFQVYTIDFSDELVRRSFYQILIHRKFPIKDRKFFLMGPPDNRKTSWFATFQGDYYVYFNTFKVMLSRKDLLQLLDCVLECYNGCLLSFPCNFKYLLTNPNIFFKH